MQKVMGTSAPRWSVWSPFAPRVMGRGLSLLGEHHTPPSMSMLAASKCVVGQTSPRLPAFSRAAHVSSCSGRARQLGRMEWPAVIANR